MSYLAKATGSFHRITREELDAQRLLNSLNSEQRCVIGGIVNGCSLRSLAAELGVPESHVEGVRSEILRKFDVRTTADLIHIGIHAGVHDAV
jgi:FixJ family two-component response regulator